MVGISIQYLDSSLVRWHTCSCVAQLDQVCPNDSKAITNDNYPGPKRGLSGPYSIVKVAFCVNYSDLTLHCSRCSVPAKLFVSHSSFHSFTGLGWGGGIYFWAWFAIREACGLDSRGA